MKFIFSWKGLVIAIIILLVLIALLITFRIDSYNRYDKVDEFNFELSWGPYGRKNISTFNDTITKDLMSAGIITTDYVLPRHVNKRIYNMMRDMEILSFPSKLYLNYIDIGHNDNLYLRVVINGEENIVSCRVPWSYNLKGVGEESVHHYQFMTLTNYISRYVYGTDEWKSLPKSVGGYL